MDKIPAGITAWTENREKMRTTHCAHVWHWPMGTLKWSTDLWEWVIKSGYLKWPEKEEERELWWSSLKGKTLIVFQGEIQRQTHLLARVSSGAQSSDHSW